MSFVWQSTDSPKKCVETPFDAHGGPISLSLFHTMIDQAIRKDSVRKVCGVTPDRFARRQARLKIPWIVRIERSVP